MKNYLYILCAFLLAFAGCTKDADVEPIAPAPDGNTQVVLTGFSGRGTRTGFGGAEDGAVPFLWSAGDYIWARNTRSEAIAEGGSQATFVFESLETADTYDVFYNLTGPAAATALIPAEQTQQAAGELNLGQNGDFGYATAQNGTFTLEHATSYVWFDTYSSDVTSNLLSITLSVSGGQTIAGEAAFADGKLGDCKGSSSVTLSFGEEGVALPSQSNDTDVFAAMVLYPADLSTATVSIVYKFADGSVYLQTKSGKTLTPGHTLRLSTQIAKSDCKNSGAFFMTEAGVAEELPTEPIGYLKVVTLGESTLSAEELTSIAGNLANGAVIDLGEATFATTEFPMDFTRKTNLQEIALPRNIQTFTPSTYNSGAFYGCKNLTRVTFPEGLTAIGQNCFRNCAKLESIELPSSVRTLDIYAFYGCKLLTSVVIPEGVEAIPRFLFNSCTALTDVTLPSTLKSIGAEAFEATGLEEITIPESVTTIESSVFKNCKSLERIQFPDALTAIPANLCNACSALTTINMPSKLETVGNDAFYNCGKLQDVTFPETLKSLDERSFGGCSAFTRIIIDIPAIANYAFWNCANVTSIDLGEKVTSIGRNAFISASNLQTITCRAENAPSLGNSAFGSAGSKVEGAKILYVPAASYDAYETAWTDVTSQGYALQDINDQQLTDGIYYRASRETDWVPTLPATFTALYVRTVGDDSRRGTGRPRRPQRYGKIDPAAGYRRPRRTAGGRNPARRTLSGNALTPATGHHRQLRHHGTGPHSQPAVRRCRSPRTSPLHQLDRTRTGTGQSHRGTLAGTGRHGSFRRKNDGPHVRRRMPAGNDRPGLGPGHPDHPARRADLVPRPAEPLRTLHAAATAGTRPPQVHPLLDARTGHRPFALRLDRPDRPTRAALPSDPGYGVQRLHRTAVQQFVRHLRHGERHDQSPQVTDSL